MTLYGGIEPILQFETFEEHLNLNDCFIDPLMDMTGHYIFFKKDTLIAITVPKNKPFLVKCEVMTYCEELGIENPPEYNYDS